VPEFRLFDPSEALGGREITHPTVPDVIVPGYEGIIGGQERLLASRDHIRGGVLAVKGVHDGP
jgi:hypothetical protein